jgi:Zn-dependent M28 family amino/carboxypeptidase
MNSDGQIHNGADDNASGVAAVMELARIFLKIKKK